MIAGHQTLRTRLGRVRGLGASKEGTAHWWGQRVTAVALLPLLFGLTVAIIRLFRAEQAEVADVFANPLVTLLAAGLVIAGYWHLQMGLKVVIEDYIHGTVPKIICEWLSAAVCLTLGGASLLAILKLAVSG
jgi:succinate dehydrogenase / fumarate reductase, membrane anchor subunit